ncbi:MAG: translocation/assembly module TamB domain-containing protein [Kiloniellaceae bacterium]
MGFGLGGLLVIGAGGVILGYTWLQSESGRDWLVRQIEAAASTPGETQLFIDNLEGDLPGNLRATGITVSDSEGSWLRVGSLEVTWRPWELLNRTLEVESLALTGVSLDRLPAEPAAATDDGAEEDAAAGLPLLPLKVRIRQLAADEIALAAPVLGQAARFSLAGEATGLDDGRLSAGLNLQRLDGVEAQLSAKFDYDPSSDRLTAEIDAAEAPGGLVATLLEVPELPRAELRLSGSGPLSAWDGDFAVSLGDVVRAEATIGLQRHGNGDLGFKLDGYSSISPPEQSAFGNLIRGRTDVALAGSWRASKRLQLERLSASSERFDLNAQGSFEPRSGSLAVTLDANTSEATLLAELLGLDRLDRASASVAVTGTVNQPEAAVELQADGIVHPDFEAAVLSTSGRVTGERDLLGPAPLLGLDFTGRLDSPRLPGNEEINRLLGAALPWAVKGTFDVSQSLFEIATLEASIESAKVSASGRFDLGDGSATLQTTLTISDLAALRPLTSIGLGGQAELAGPIVLEQFGGHLEGDLRGRWSKPSSDIRLVSLAAGSGMDLATRFVLDGAQLRLEDTSARSKAAEVDLALTVTPDARLRDARYSLRLPEAAVLADELGVALSGAAEVEGEMAGPFDALTIDGTARLKQLAIEDQLLSDIGGTYRLRLNGADIDGPVTIAVTSPFGPVDASADFKLRQDAVTLSAIQATLPDTTVNGSVALPLDGGAPLADLTAEIADLAPWLAFAGMTGNGKGTLEVMLNGPNQAAPVLANAEISGIRLVVEPGATPFSAARLTLSLQAQDPALEQPGSFKLQAENLKRDQMALDRLEVDGAGTAANLDLTLAATGTWLEPFEIRAAAAVSQETETLSVTLREAEGRAFGQPLRLREAALLTLAPSETRLEHLDLASGDTQLKANARLGDGKITATAALDNLPMRTVDAFWDSGVTGTVSASLQLEGTLDDPRGTAELTATGLRPRDSKDLPALELTAAADWQNGRAKLTGQLGGPLVTAARFDLEGPLAIAADGSGVELPDDDPLAGSVNWSGKVATLLLFVPLPEHRLSGDVAIGLDIGGTAGRPSLDGDISLTGGRYENLETGTILKDLGLAAKVSDDRVTLASLTANDGAKGRVTGGGGMTIDPQRQFPFEFDIKLDKFRAVRRDDVTAVIGGTVKLDGTAQAPRIESRITTETIEINLTNGLPPNVASLDVIEIKNGVVQQAPQEAEEAPAVEAALDIVVEMPNRIFVRGRGLDSEWSGRISVQGSSANPAISGKVELVRGQLSLVGKTFKLKEGQVTLPKSANSDPMLDVTAVHEGEALLVTAKMSGPLSKPELELTSSPEVPRDEIISRVLFNKSAANLSAAEAAQLAIALRDLTGNGGGADVLGFARRTMGVDVLRVDTTGDGKAQLEAGKYVTDQVYLGVKQGADTQSNSAGVEVELTPNITVESEVTGSGANKSGVRFQLDY